MRRIVNAAKACLDNPSQEDIVRLSEAVKGLRRQLWSERGLRLIDAAMLYSQHALKGWTRGSLQDQLAVAVKNYR